MECKVLAAILLDNENREMYFEIVENLTSYQTTNRTSKLEKQK